MPRQASIAIEALPNTQGLLCTLSKLSLTGRSVDTQYVELPLWNCHATSPKPPLLVIAVTRSSEKTPKPCEKLNRRRYLTCVAGALGGVMLSRTSSAGDANGQALGRGRSRPSYFKQQAQEDYQRSLSSFGGQLSWSPERLEMPCPRPVPWQFDIVVIGSGYGASTVAARLAARKQPHTRLAVFERGKEWIPGTFPDTLRGVLKESRLTLLGPRKGTINKATGLFNVEQFQELTVVSGVGLGGGSLINANVTIRPDADLFSRPEWPTALRSRAILDPYYELAEYELSARREPVDASNKMITQRLAAMQLLSGGAHWEPARLAVTRTNCQPTNSLPIQNPQGMLQRGCIDCGDCLSGCNVGAKNTLAMNYLPLARRSGAEIYTGIEVKFIRRVHGWYELHYDRHVDLPDGSIETTSGFTTARMVCLGGGSLGSTAILMRSAHHGLRFSPRLGCSWTGNGDALGFIRKTQFPTGIGGFSAYPTERNPVGPTIQSNLTYPHRPWQDRVLIQDGAAPRAYATALGLLMRNLRLDNTQVLLGMGHDGAAGRVFLNEHGQPQVTWPDLLDGPYRQMIRNEFQQVAQAMGGKYEFLRAFGDRMISVHPLGGCAMADDCGTGVVNERGQVYNAAEGGVYPGLYVADGAVLPTSIGCNPLLTITAIAERISDLLLNDALHSDLFVPEQPPVGAMGQVSYRR